MYKLLLTTAATFILSSCGFTPTGAQQRGYNVVFGELTLSGGPLDEDQSLRESADIDVCACTFASGLCSVVEYEATIQVSVQVHEGRDFAQGLEVRITDYDLSFTAIESISSTQDIFITFPQKTVNFGSDEGPVIDVGDSDTVEEDLAINFVGNDDLIRYRIDIENALGTTAATQLEDTFSTGPEGLYSFPATQWKLVLYFEDNYGSKASEVVQGTLEVGDFDSNEESCDN